MPVVFSGSQRSCEVNKGQVVEYLKKCNSNEFMYGIHLSGGLKVKRVNLQNFLHTSSDERDLELTSRVGVPFGILRIPLLW